MPTAVEVCGIQLPGHGNRLREPLFDRLVPLVRALTSELVSYLDRPFAFFGHSMGALIAFELARRLAHEWELLPAHLFVSGHSAPQINAERPTFDLPEAEFIEELSRLSGTPNEVLEHPELLNLMLPILRADFAISQTYEYINDLPLDCNLSAFGGLQDVDVPISHLEAWRLQTSKDFRLHMFPGDHFFLQTARSSLMRALSQELEPLI